MARDRRSPLLLTRRPYDVVMGLTLVLAMGTACTSRTNAVQLSATSSRGPLALLCREGMDPMGGPRMPPPPMDAGPMGSDGAVYLIERAREAGSVRLVIDYFTIGGGVPGCMPSQLFDHCAANCCAHVTSARSCLDVPLPDAGSLTRPELANLVLSSAHGHVASTDAPDGYVIVRMVATTETCDAVMPTDGGVPSFVTSELVGCAYSCPVVLDTVQGTLSLDLPTFSDQCAALVDSCAHQFEQLSGACQ